MDTVENMDCTEQCNYIIREIKEFKLAVKDLIDSHQKLLARNKELEKENKKLRDIIQEMSQEK